MEIQTGRDLAAACKSAATAHKTIYVWGCFGAPMTQRSKDRWLTPTYSYNLEDYRKPKLLAADENTFGFDCIGLIKGLLWGWEGDNSKIYGGAKYTSNNVPDISTASIIKVCSDISRDFSTIAVGELLHMDGHAGIYIGEGLAVEATPDWADGVQITAVGNIGSKTGYPTRTWERHGKLPYVTYAEKPSEIIPLPYLQIGQVNDLLLTMKALLNLQGYSCSLQNHWDDRTQQALREYQSSYGISEEGCGPLTWKKLLGMGG